MKQAMKQNVVRFKRLDARAVLPSFATPGAAGMDLYAVLDEPYELKPAEIKLIGTGFAMALPVGMEAQVRSRSGLSLKHGVIVLNAPGTIDSDYRGEVGVILFNAAMQPYTVKPGERIAQMVLARHATVIDTLFEEVEDLDETARGAGGFGSTGAL